LQEVQSKKTENYGSEGMSVEMCIGVAISTLFDGGISIVIPVGMLLGLCIGSCIPKENDE